MVKNIITKDIARLICNCYTEIEVGKEMIDELKSKLNDKGELKLVDNYQESKGLELRIHL